MIMAWILSACFMFISLIKDKNTSIYQDMLVILSKQHHFAKYDFNP
jgi:hypothetical protein